MPRCCILLLVALVGCTSTQITSDEAGVKQLEQELSSLRLVKPVGVGEEVISPDTIEPARLQGEFTFPLDGAVETRFGQLRDGLKLQGMLIRGMPGAGVKACAYGSVIYVYEKFPGFGKVIIIDCGNRLHAVYGRQARNLVKTGDKVHPGQEVARLAAASTQEPVLYFAIYRGGQPIDPLSVLPGH